MPAILRREKVEVLLPEEELNSKGFPSSIGSFSELFDKMKSEIHQKKLMKKR